MVDITENGRHILRFKRGGIEFEIVSTAEQVATVWMSIEPSVVEAFASGEVEEEEETEQVEPTTTEGTDRTRTRRRRTTRRRAPGSGEGRGGRAEIASRLADADLTKFPKLPARPSAQMVGYATLHWAHSELDIDGLTATEIARFNTDRRRFSRTHQAFTQALGKRVSSGEVDVRGTPQVFRLMADGETALKTYIEEQAKK